MRPGEAGEAGEARGASAAGTTPGPTGAAKSSEGNTGLAESGAAAASLTALAAELGRAQGDLAALLPAAEAAAADVFFRKTLAAAGLPLPFRPCMDINRFERSLCDIQRFTCRENPKPCIPHRQDLP